MWRLGVRVRVRGHVPHRECLAQLVTAHLVRGTVRARGRVRVRRRVVRSRVRVRANVNPNPNPNTLTPRHLEQRGGGGGVVEGLLLGPTLCLGEA